MEPVPEPEKPPAEPEPETRPPRADVDGPVLRPSFRSKDIVIDIPGERSRNNKLVLAGATALGVIAGGIGLHYHLDSRNASNDVSSDIFTGRAWRPADDDIVARADRSRTRAAIGYSIGGAFIAAAIVGLIVTEPKTERTVIRPHASVEPTHGGALLGGTWSF